MSIGTFSELKTAIENWLGATHLQAREGEFITLAEARINRDLDRINAAWSNGVLTGTLSSRSIALPTLFAEAQTLWLTTSGQQDQLTPFVNGTIELSTTNGTPRAWSINGQNIDLDCPCDSAHTFLFRYRTKWQLSDASPTNWLLTNYPDVYLAASLVEAFGLQSDDASALRWEAKYRQGVEDIENNEARSLAVAPLMIDPILMPGRGRNTLSDWTAGFT